MATGQGINWPLVGCLRLSLAEMRDDEIEVVTLPGVFKILSTPPRPAEVLQDSVLEQHSAAPASGGSTVQEPLSISQIWQSEDNPPSSSVGVSSSTSLLGDNDVVVDLSADVDELDGLHHAPELISKLIGRAASFHAASGADVANSLNPKKRRYEKSVEPEI